MPHTFLNGKSIQLSLLTALALVNTALAQPTASDDKPQPTLLAKRGALIVDDNGSIDRGGKVIGKLGEKLEVKAALGIWQRSTPGSNTWRSTWEKGMGHPPVASYRGLELKNLIVEVDFRYGPKSDPSHSQFLRIAADQRPQIKGHIVSAWVNISGEYTKKGFVLEHVGAKTPDKKRFGMLYDHQPLKPTPEIWQTATLEIVDDEALFRMGDHVAYAKGDEINIQKNLVSLTLGTTWHEIKRVRIWHAEANPEWEKTKEAALKNRSHFQPRPRE